MFTNYFMNDKMAIKDKKKLSKMKHEKWEYSSIS